MPTFNYEQAAQVLIETLFTDEETVTQRYGITSRTIYNYRKRLLTDPHFSSFFNAKKAALEREWANEIAPAIRECIAFLKRAAKAVDPKSPEAIHAVAGALKILSEVSMTREVIDARLAVADRSQRAQTGALATPPASIVDHHAQA